MDISKLILSRTREQGQISVAEIVKETGFSRAYIYRFFQKLVEGGQLSRVGHTDRSRYTLATVGSIKKAKENLLNFSRVFNNKDLHEDRVFNLIKSETSIFDGIGENIAHILEYAFTEMFNNAIEHSSSLKIKATIKREGKIIRFDVIDWGVGIFEKLIHTRHLANTDEAIQDLLKGKQTTDPESHSGEGIFFTRRIADTFSIRSSAKKIFFNNAIDDFTIVTIKPVFGTRIMFSINSNSKTILRDVFSKYVGESFEFSTTDVIVRLYEKGTETFISRSQARRILYGLEKFKKIILDFDKVKMVGQGFADETFRIWQNKNPSIEIIFKNANEDINFMINGVIKS